jgi:hypothetical protein
MNISAVSTPIRKSQASARSVEIFQPVRHHLERRPRGLLGRRTGRALGDRAEIVAGAEGAAGAGQHQHADGGIGL